jgi:hypothetical protein
LENGLNYCEGGIRLPSEGLDSAYDAAIVSFDIVSHSSADGESQLSRVVAINHIVAQTIDSCGNERVVWASGGDGGHVVFRQAGWVRSAIDLIARLRQWSSEAQVPLRVSAHIGPVTNIFGADGRVQVVGDGINLASWILRRGSSEGVVVSDTFRNSVEKVKPSRSAVFHDSRVLRHKDQARKCLMLMSIESDRSRWSFPVEEDREELSRALQRGDGWDVLYLAKRILQANTADAHASQAIQRLGPIQLTYKSVTASGGRGVINPFLGYLEPPLLREIVQLGQLVERRYNDVICRYGDKGDTMFVILRGEVGVYKSEGEGSGKPAEPAFVHEEGEIVGELAFALARDRTADLIALSDVALLSFSYDDISNRLSTKRSGRLARERVSRFIESRALEHISHNVPYLLGNKRTGPLAAGPQSWREALSILEDDTRLISVGPHNLRVTLSDLEQPAGPSSGHGIYILAAGQLRGGVDGIGADGIKKIHSDSFPILWVDIPGVLVLPKFSFDVEAEPVKILHIESDGITRLEALKREALYGALRRAAASCYHFDVFISYNFRDEQTARRWADALRRKGFQPYIDTPDRGTEFPLRLRTALLSSRAIIALISPYVMVRDPEHNWVLRETRFHQQYFDRPRIFPVCLPGGDHEQIVPGFASIDVGADEQAAIEQVALELSRLRDGFEDPPFSLHAKDELKLI